MRIVVINNDGGGIFEFLPQAEQLDGDEFEALLGTPTGSRSSGSRRSTGSRTGASTGSTSSGPQAARRG